MTLLWVLNLHFCSPGVVVDGWLAVVALTPTAAEQPDTSVGLGPQVGGKGLRGGHDGVNSYSRLPKSEGQRRENVISAPDDHIGEA